MCTTRMIHQQLWGYKIENKLHLGGTRTKNVEYHWSTRIWRTVYCSKFNRHVAGTYCLYRQGERVPLHLHGVFYSRYRRDNPETRGHRLLYVPSSSISHYLFLLSTFSSLRPYVIVLWVSSLLVALAPPTSDKGRGDNRTQYESHDVTEVDLIARVA
jgi:hypothetical protein